VWQNHHLTAHHSHLQFDIARISCDTVKQPAVHTTTAITHQHAQPASRALRRRLTGRELQFSCTGCNQHDLHKLELVFPPRNTGPLPQQPQNRASKWQWHGAGKRYWRPASAGYYSTIHKMQNTCYQLVRCVLSPHAAVVQQQARSKLCALLPLHNSLEMRITSKKTAAHA